MAAKQNVAELSKIIKRLELIKSLIALEEESEINTHVSKLKEFSTDIELGTIISLLEQKAYSQAMPAIETYINQHRQITAYIDPEIEGLKLEAKSLEAELNALSDEKADLETGARSPAVEDSRGGAAVDGSATGRRPRGNAPVPVFHRSHHPQRVATESGCREDSDSDVSQRN